MTQKISKDPIDAMIESIEQNPINLAQEVLERGHAACYQNEDGLMIKEFPDGRIYHINIDLKTGETIYLKQLK